MSQEYLPLYIISNILLRIPVKSLARFRCVSKIWSETINDSYFAIMHAKQAPEQPTLLMFHQEPAGDPNLPNVQCTMNFPHIIESKEEDNTTSLEVVSKSHVMKFLCKRLGDDLARYLYKLVLGSCNGLLYSYQYHPDGITFFVIQPLKKECYELPPIKIWSSSNAYIRESCGLGFDGSTNTLKMVCVLNKREYIFWPTVDQVRQNLCTMVHDFGTDSWRKILETPSYPITGEGVFAHGCLHWRTTYCYASERKVIWFDMSKETFGMIDPPPVNNHSNGYLKEKLVDLNGEVGFVYECLHIGVEVWILKQKQQWVMHCRFDHKPLPERLSVLGCWNKDGDILVKTSGCKRLFVYTLKSRSLHEANIVGMEDGCKTEFRMYRSNLISIQNF